MADMALIQRLEALATEFDTTDPQAAQRFRDLAGGLRTGGNATAVWAFSPLDSLFDAEKLVARRGGPIDRDGISRSEKWRNVLVLVPLVVTWIGIAWAASAYSSLLARDPAQAAQSFIYLWQDGFEQTMPLTLGRVAIIDGLILTAVILLTAIVYFRGSRHSRAQEDDASGLRAEIESTMYDVDRALASYRAPEAAQVALQVNEVAKTNLDLMGKISESNLAQMTKVTETSLAQISEMNKASLAQLTEMTQQLVATIGQEYQRFEGLANQRAEEIAGLTAFTSQLQGAGQDIREGTEALTAAHAQILHNVSGLQIPIAGLAAATLNLSQNVAEVVPAVTTASQELTKLTKEQSSSVAGLQDLSKLQKTVADGMQEGVKSLGASVVAAAQATSELSAASNHLSREQVSLIDALEKERSSQSELANYVSRTNYNFGQVLDQFSQAVVSINATAKDMTYAAQKFQTMEEIVRNLQMGLGDLVKAQATAAAQIQAATNRIELAAGSFEQTVRSLAQASDALSQSALSLAHNVSTPRM
jgi:chromosome segregation ATPase